MTQQSPSILPGSSVNKIGYGKSLFPLSLPICLRTLAASLGFSCSAGWDWLPVLHNEDLRDMLESRQVAVHTGLFGDIASLDWFSVLMLIFLGLALDNLFLTLQLRRSGSLRNPDLVRHCAFSGPVLFSPVINERIHLVLPALIVQGIAVGLLVLVEWYGASSLYSLVPWILGTVSALFGLLWFALIIFLPGVWCCIAYALAAAFGFGLSMLLAAQSVEGLLLFRLLLPVLGFPLLFLAMPPSRDIKARLVMYRRRSLHRTGARRFFRLWRIFKPSALLGVFSRTNMLGTTLYLFVLLYGAQFLLEFVFGGFIIPMDVTPEKYLAPGQSIALLGQACGAVLAMGMVVVFSKNILLVLILGMSLFGLGALFISLNELAFFPTIVLYVATGCCSAFGLFVMQTLLRGQARIFRVLGWGLALTVSWGLFGGYLLWFLATSFSGADAYQGLYMQLLALTALFCVFVFYWIWKKYQPIFITDTLPEVACEPEPILQESLTAREREVASMVQAGIKNIEISEMLHISDATLRVHLRRIYRKLGIQGRAKLKEMPPFHR